ncbi:energy transducer TonB [Pseudoalteromonas luteoviolacea]|uniref:Protein TonB n=1 Tax=Pseudoalteromonas luteoviolacea DSM 6061 TaxID=1365250 RepID=A0A166ZA60_9GAMM|nr:energy transducer TonB [Pseudoalteromonas luteoviolacea]KZN44100.1 hypothetical protein N475_08300 [Pseudoalteromonas luteoviolacea DSM 6061]MBE0386213.1 hypothetical protein [Pseudoalteromonas luteoviolacea DSM 6061]
MSFISAMLLSAVSSQVTPANNPQIGDIHKETIVNAVAVKRVEPVYPVQAARKGQEGWVELSYVVNENGEVESVLVENSSGIRSFEKAALNAVKQWKFDPATQNNKPVKQCQNQIQMNFLLNNAEVGVSRRFLGRYKKLITKIENNELEGVPEKLEELRAINLGNFTENSHFWTAEARYYYKTGEKEKELEALNKVAYRGKEYLNRDMYVASVARATILNLEKNKLKHAMLMFDKLSQTKGGESHTKQLFPYIDKVEAFIADESKQIWVQGEISERSIWQHDLARSAFTIANVQGNLTSLEVRCANQYSVYDVKQGLQWNIPQSWQRCRVYVHGSKGATFNLVETSSTEQTPSTGKA